MRLIAMTLLITNIALAGCSDREKDNQIAQLSSDVRTLRNQNADLRQNGETLSGEVESLRRFVQVIHDLQIVVTVEGPAQGDGGASPLLAAGHTIHLVGGPRELPMTTITAEPAQVTNLDGGRVSIVLTYFPAAGSNPPRTVADLSSFTTLRGGMQALIDGAGIDTLGRVEMRINGIDLPVQEAAISASESRGSFEIDLSAWTPRLQETYLDAVGASQGS